MNFDEVRQALRARPFRPFRLFVTDGASYDVRHPELCMAGPRIVIVGTQPPGQSEPILDRYAIIDLIHITRLEPLDVPTTGNGQA